MRQRSTELNNVQFGVSMAQRHTSKKRINFQI